MSCETYIMSTDQHEEITCVGVLLTPEPTYIRLEVPHLKE